jgi:hypothetical protein
MVRNLVRLAAASALLLSGARASAQGAPGVVWQVVSAGTGSSSAGQVRVDATLGQFVAHAPAAGNPMLGGGYWRAPLRDRDEIACGLQAADSNVFHQTQRVTVQVEAAGPGTLHCLRVIRNDVQHPAWELGIDASAYWTLTGFDDGGGTAAGYALAFTFMQPGYPDPFACHWGGVHWDCGRTSFDASSVTRNAVTMLADWAVGSANVPVELLDFTVE